MTLHTAAIFGCADLALRPDEAAFFAEAQPWGFILFARNIETPDQVRRLTSDLRNAVGWNAPVFIDQEGGRVQRMTPPTWRGWHPALEQVEGSAPGQAGRGMYLRYRLIAHELRDIGIDANCAPVGDLVQDNTHPVLRNRCYGSDPDTVDEIGRQVAQGLLDGGVLPVIKHIPGHGRGLVDSHHELPRTDASRKVLNRQDFAVFAGLARLPLGMSAHVVYEAIDPEAPGTHSPAVIQMIRDDIGFDGLLMTDDLSMNALQGTVAERAVRALEAGCEIALHCNGDLDEMQSVAEAIGVMRSEAVGRAEEALTWRRTPDPLDVAAAEAELAQCVPGGAYV